MIEIMLVNHDFATKEVKFNKGDVYLCSPQMKKAFTETLRQYAILKNNPKALHSVEFHNLDNILPQAHRDGNFKNMLLIRYGGIGDLIALSSIIDYFEDCRVHFVTQKKFFPVFDWFIKKPILYDVYKPIFNNFKYSDVDYKLSNWVRYHGEGLIENGHSRNWFELFFEFVGESEPDKEMLRPQLRTDRISNDYSNIQLLNTGKPSLLICNKASAMMRSCHVKDIIESLPDKEKYTIYVYRNNCSKSDLEYLKNTDIEIILNTDLKTFLLDCYDADMVITVDSGSLHFREGINKPAIGLYNSFTTDSRVKHYQYTKSFDIKSNCDMHPCFIHEKPSVKYCPKGNKEMFAAPCFSSEFNLTLKSQLKQIFNNYLYTKSNVISDILTN